MTKLQSCLYSALLVLVLPAGGLAAEWQPAKGPLATRWAKDVSAKRVHPEYPRPQMVRKDWLSLNGLWQLSMPKEKSDAPPAKYEEQILVPFPVESALSGVMKHADRLWYRREFAVPKSWQGKRVLLHFGAVDWETTVLVNGKQVGTHRGGYDSFNFDITDALKSDVGQESGQEIIVQVFDPTDAGDQPRGKQVNKPGGIFYTPTTGIWQSVWIEPVETAHVERLELLPDVDRSCLRLKVHAGKSTGRVEAVASQDGKEIARASGEPGKELKLAIAEPKLWSPKHPHLYDLKVKLSDSDRPVDEVDSYFGMRKIEIGPDDQGKVRLKLNGKFVFQAGPLDQGFWPDGLYTAPTDEALRYDIEVTKQLGFNMTRKHVKVEPARWYYWCDKLGLLVWQDMPSGDNKSPAAHEQFGQELRRLVTNLGNHPSIVMWVVFNEGWGQHDTERLTKRVKELDPSRIVSNASGWTDKKAGDVIDVHNYPAPSAPPAESARASVLGEFGGLSLGVDGHTWTDKIWGYQGTSSKQELTARYESLLRGVWQLRDSAGLSAAVYTQITDVETEANGLLTYDREVIKVDVERVADVNRGRLPEYKPLAATSQKEPQTWQYTTQKPADPWADPAFDASSWKSGPGGFGTKKTPGSVVRTEWDSSDIWLRREFTLPETKEPAGNPRELMLSIHHDEDAEIYLNGVLAAKPAAYTADYGELPIRGEARAALKPGTNVLAVHCHQTSGGQYIDVGLIERLPPKVTQKGPWKSLFDGKSLGDWKPTEFGGQGEVEVEDGRIVLGQGADMTGITWKGELPRMDYEIALDAMRVEGHDFFCGLTFPVGEDPCSLIVGGWGGGVVGLSSIDHHDASENNTTKYIEFEKGRWYHIRLQVAPGRIKAWIDKKQIIDADVAGRKISIRSEVALSKPLGISTWNTTGALKNIKLRRVTTAAKPEKPAEKPASTQ